MKTAIACPICYKPRRYSESYAVKLYEYEEREQTGGTVVVKPEYRKIRVCRNCIRKMGYKVKLAPKSPKGV